MSLHITQFASFCEKLAGDQTVVFVKTTPYESFSLWEAFQARGFKYASTKHWVKDGAGIDNFDIPVPDIGFIPPPEPPQPSKQTPGSTPGFFKQQVEVCTPF
jgi:hypothetical protein